MGCLRAVYFLHAHFAVRCFRRDGVDSELRSQGGADASARYLEYCRLAWRGLCRGWRTQSADIIWSGLSDLTSHRINDYNEAPTLPDRRRLLNFLCCLYRYPEHKHRTCDNSF